MKDNTDHYQYLNKLRFLLAPQHECSYLSDHSATTLFVDPGSEIDTQTYSFLTDLGFRRSGEHVYRPHCADCRQCVSVRINVNRFVPSRSQRRNLTFNTDLETSFRPAEFSVEHFDLYQKYMGTRHTGSSMDCDDPEHYMRMMKSSWCDTWLMEVRYGDRLLAVAIIDRLAPGLSAVYTFFDPDEKKRGLGVYTILKQIEKVKTTDLHYVYLGYWIAQSNKMSYKNQFSGLEYFNGHHWLPTPP